MNTNNSNKKINTFFNYILYKQKNKKVILMTINISVNYYSTKLLSIVNRGFD